VGLWLGDNFYLELSWTEWLAVAVAIAMLVFMLGAILDDFRRAKNPTERMMVVPQEYEHLMTIEEKRRYVNWYFRYSSPKRLAGLLIAMIIWYLLKQYLS
jgi:hypothetical protein